MKESSFALPRVSIPLNGSRPRRFMNPGEIGVIVSLMRSVNPKTVIEIGVNDGLTAGTLLGEVPTIERYIGVDVPYGHVPSCHAQRYEVPEHAGHIVRRDPRFELVLRLRGSRDLGPDDLPLCDAMFIDGDHSLQGVFHDAALAEMVVKPGGIIVYHDYHDLGTVGVRDALHQLFADGHRLFHVEGTWLAYENR